MDATASDAVFRFDRFALYPNRGLLLTTEGQEITLRPKAFAVLRLLVENAGRLLDRDAIMRAVWSDVIIADDGITQCIRDIRRALADDAQRIVRTVRQRGYILALEVTVTRERSSVRHPNPAGCRQTLYRRPSLQELERRPRAGVLLGRDSR